jgi:hypothetical protein
LPGLRLGALLYRYKKSTLFFRAEPHAQNMAWLATLTSCC